MKDKLVVKPDERFKGFVIGWWSAEEGALRALMGSSKASDFMCLDATGDAKEVLFSHNIAYKLWRDGIGKPSYSEGRYLWREGRDAREALKTLKMLMAAARADAAWPDWSIKAKGAGWTAPRGWKP